MERQLSVIMAGGGPGHIEPAMAVTQELDARTVVGANGGRIAADAELTPKIVIDEVIPLLMDADIVSRTGRAVAGAKHRGAAAKHRGAAEVVARIVPEVASR
ncbi:hypothetical protein [Nocardia jejuensis]|uniref:hypothetical protein n=1 Tax=Nocardia jejuensis TaxID=328049 RepID=UPI00082D380E|nr:hypothetical protein [Nocardia jejuensis]